MGYSPSLAVGTWVGNNDNTPMGGGLSGLIVTPMWREFFDIALKKIDPENKDAFAQPEIKLSGLKPILRGEYIDTTTLLEAAQNNNGDVDLGMLYNNIHSILHFVDKDNPQGPYPTNPARDPQYKNWEWAVQSWKEETFGSLAPATSTETTTLRDTETTEESTPRRSRRNN